jgi:hypothetical protein
VRAVLARAQRPWALVEGLALAGVEHRQAGEHHAPHLLGSRGGEFGRDQCARLVAEHVHLAQPERVEQVGDRRGVIRHRRRRLRGVRTAVPGKIGGIDAAVLAELGKHAAEGAAIDGTGVHAHQRHQLVEAPVRGKRGVHVQLAVAAVHVHAAQVHGHGRRLAGGGRCMACGAAGRRALHGRATSGIGVRQVDALSAGRPGVTLTQLSKNAPFT